MHEHSQQTWYASVRRYTEQLVHIRGISPERAENNVGEAIFALLCEEDRQDRQQNYTQVGFDHVKNDLYERQNVYALLRGHNAPTLILLGHYDTVGIQDYGNLEALALDPAALAAKHVELGTVLAETSPDDWMFGRGTGDMKSGVAVNIALIRYFAQLSPDIPLSLLFVATPDEENESAGILSAVDLLTRLRDEYALEYVGVLNTDYTTAQYLGDPHRYIYTGSVGKLLPSFLCIGRESHVGTPFQGLDANLIMSELISRLSMNNEFCDEAEGQVTAPPVTLHATDLKTHYNVQLPSMAYFYLNVLTFSTTPKTLMERLQHYSESALREVCQRMHTMEDQWNKRAGITGHTVSLSLDTGTVLTYKDLYRTTTQRMGHTRVVEELRATWEQLPESLDLREQSLRLVQRLWTLSEKQGPAIVLYYSPPYYPHVTLEQGPLLDAIAEVMGAHRDIPLVRQHYFPYLSDLSYLCLGNIDDLSTLTSNMPVWRPSSEKTEGTPKGYTLPFETIRALDIPVVNFGVYGQGAHQRNEGVLMSYSFGILPELLCETIERVARRL